MLGVQATKPKAAAKPKTTKPKAKTAAKPKKVRHLRPAYTSPSLPSMSAASIISAGAGCKEISGAPWWISDRTDSVISKCSLLTRDLHRVQWTES